MTPRADALSVNGSSTAYPGAVSGRFPWFCTLVLLTTLLACAGDPGGLRFSMLGWVLPGALAFIIVLLNANRVHWRFFIPWAPWVAIVVVYTATSSNETALVREPLILTPLVVGLAASTFRVRDRDLEVAFAAFTASALAFLLIFFTRFIFRPPEFRYYFPGECITALLLASVFATRYLLKKETSTLLMWGLMCLVPVLTVARMNTLAAALTIPLTLAPFSSRKRALLLVLLAAGAIAVFYTGAFQQKMFFSGSGTLSDLASEDSDLSTSGRAALWLVLWEGVSEHLWFGHGANASEPVVQALANLSHPHNDYLRILYEFGVAGLISYLVGTFATIIALLRLVSHSPQHRWWKYAVASSFVPYLLTMFTDNVITYASYFGNLQFALIGLLVARTNDQCASARVTFASRDQLPTTSS